MMTAPVLEQEALTSPETDESQRPLLVCFVCTGNTCRSPMAEAAANALAKDCGADIRAYSAGLYACVGEPIAEHALLALEHAGIAERVPACRMHTAHSLQTEEAERYDLLVGMSAEHAMELLMRFPSLAGKITCFSPSIADPFGGSLAVYEDCLAQILAGVKSMLFPEVDA